MSPGASRGAGTQSIAGVHSQFLQKWWAHKDLAESPGLGRKTRRTQLRGNDHKRARSRTPFSLLPFPRPPRRVSDVDDSDRVRVDDPVENFVPVATDDFDADIRIVRQFGSAWLFGDCSNVGALSRLLCARNASRGLQSRPRRGE